MILERRRRRFVLAIVLQRAPSERQKLARRLPLGAKVAIAAFALPGLYLAFEGWVRAPAQLAKLRR